METRAFTLVLLIAFAFSGAARADDFFKILDIGHAPAVPTKAAQAVWITEGVSRMNWKTKKFVPYIEVKVQTDERYLGSNCVALVHFFDRKNQLIATVKQPSFAWRSQSSRYSMPLVFPKQKSDRLFFAIPKEVTGSDWRAVAVFGDKDGLSSILYPKTASDFGLKYPERELVEHPTKLHVQREPAKDPIISFVAKTDNPRQPKITLLLRLPAGIDDPAETKGVLALCLLANNVDDMKRQLLAFPPGTDASMINEFKAILKNFERLDPERLAMMNQRLDHIPLEKEANVVGEVRRTIPPMEPDEDVKRYNENLRRIGALEGKIQMMRLIRFADQNQLAVIAWGARSLWDRTQSYDELSRKVNKKQDAGLDEVAEGWEKGILQLNESYGLPVENYLLWGLSGAAQYSLRLALRRPQYFLAVHAHIPSSFDQPTVEGRNTLWLLTTGEREGGYPAAQRFYADCVKTGYPIIFKAIPGLGHQGSYKADNLGLAFFKYALTLQEEKTAFLAWSKGKSLQPTDFPWPKSFRSPAFLGDFINQDIYPARLSGSPLQFVTRLPTQEIADSW